MSDHIYAAGGRGLILPTFANVQRGVTLTNVHHLEPHAIAIGCTCSSTVTGATMLNMNILPVALIN